MDEDNDRVMTIMTMMTMRLKMTLTMTLMMTMPELTRPCCRKTPGHSWEGRELLSSPGQGLDLPPLPPHWYCQNTPGHQPGDTQLFIILEDSFCTVYTGCLKSCELCFRLIYRCLKASDQKSL